MIVALAGQKGGAGKSTLAVCLAVEALTRGRRVLLVDADPQGTARTWAEVAAELDRPAPTTISMGASMHRDGQLRALATGYDLTLIDCPPRHGDIQRAALMVADRVLIPCGPSAAEVWALTDTLNLLGEAQTLRPELIAHGVLTKIQPRTEVATGGRRALEGSALPVLESRCGFRVAYQESLAGGEGVTTYEPTGAAAREIRRLYDELFGAPSKASARRA